MPEWEDMHCCTDCLVLPMVLREMVFTASRVILLYRQECFKVKP